MSIKEDELRNNESVPSEERQKHIPVTGSISASQRSTQIKRKSSHNHKNLKQIFILSFDALRERKTRSILTILMVVAGGALMVALNGMSAGVADLISKQLNFLAPNYKSRTN